MYDETKLFSFAELYTLLYSPHAQMFLVTVQLCSETYCCMETYIALCVTGDIRNSANT
jgi:hypothetical protein